MSVETQDGQTEQPTSDEHCWVFQVVWQITQHTVLTASDVTAALTKQLQNLLLLIIHVCRVNHHSAYTHVNQPHSLHPRTPCKPALCMHTRQSTTLTGGNSLSILPENLENNMHNSKIKMQA